MILALQETLRQNDGEIVCLAADKRLARAARTEGITVVDPELDSTCRRVLDPITARAHLGGIDGGGDCSDAQRGVTCGETSAYAFVHTLPQTVEATQQALRAFLPALPARLVPTPP